MFSDGSKNILLEKKIIMEMQQFRFHYATN